jgi:hypothetical protein
VVMCWEEVNLSRSLTSGIWMDLPTFSRIGRMIMTTALLLRLFFYHIQLPYQCTLLDSSFSLFTS